MSKFIVLFLLLTLLVSSCNKEKVDRLNGQKILIDMRQSKVANIDEVFRKIELVPLETRDSSLIGSLRRVLFVKDKYYITIDKYFHIVIFDSKGKYVANSSKAEGKGPEKYYVLLDAAYNYTTKNIEILTPEGIVTFNERFDFIGRHRVVTDNEKLMFHKFFPIGESLYVLIPSSLSDEFNVLYFYDAKKESIVGKEVYKDYFSKLAQNDTPIRYDGFNYYFSPNATSYFSYMIDCKNLSLRPVFRYDFGSDNIDIEDLNRFSSDDDVRDYLAFKSRYPLPLWNLFNEKYIVSWIRMKEKYYTYILNRQTGKSQLLQSKFTGGILVPQYLAIDGNVLLTVIQPYELKKYVGNNLVSPEAKKVIANIANDNNPLVVKFYLK